MFAVLIAIAAYSAFMPHANPGTFAVIQDGAGIVRVDTRTGSMERCSLVGNTLTCAPVSVASK